MKKKLAVMLSALMTTGLLLSGCTSSQPAESAEASAAETAAAGAESEAAGEAVATVKGGMEGGTSLNFTTGGDQGTYYGFGGVLAGKVGESTSTTVTAITSGGSQANIEAMDVGDAQLGFVQSDVMAYA